VKTAIFCICGSNNWETVVETGKLRWATYRFDPYDRHNLVTSASGLPMRTTTTSVLFDVLVAVINEIH